MARLLACPFCRELFPDSEADRCPECGVILQPLERLPPSLDALQDEVDEGQLVAPEDRTLPLSYLRRGRGILLVLAVLGLVAFFMPWVIMRAPEARVYSGFDLARGRAGWLWGGAIGWFILIPLVITRRTIHRLRGVRIVSAAFAVMTFGEVAVLLSLPPHANSPYLYVDFSWAWGLYASGVISLLGTLFAARLGGRLDDLPAFPWRDDYGRRHVESSHGETVH